MEPWGWIVVYLVGFTLVQLLLFRYVGDDRSFGDLSVRSGEDSTPRSVETGATTTEGRQPQSDHREDGDGVHCPRCGTRNAEEGYTYCRACVGKLA